VVTGLVQEFEFGMNWGAYSRLVGNVFGAPLAMEGLGAFFLESVFLGLWLFGWDKLSRRVHLATIWAVAFGSAFSALFILAANSWMQHPVGSPWSTQAAVERYLGFVHQSGVHRATPVVFAPPQLARLSRWWLARAPRQELGVH
jgi:cytochrome bd-type quinol oxidase subunit 1